MLTPAELVEKMLGAGPVRVRLSPQTVLTLLDRVEPYFRKEPTLLRARGPLVVCGDIHGQYSDLLRVLKRFGPPSSGRRFLFLGDYVDRGKHSLECVTLLFALKCVYPQRVLLLRGNHEIPSVNRSYGFLGELRMRFARSGLWQLIHDRFNRVFSVLPLAALVDNRILCLHGGLAPDLLSLSQIEAIRRPILEPTGLAECLLWSDPDTAVPGFIANKSRGVAFCFGPEAADSKCRELGVERVLRGHQLVDEGYESFANGRVLTVFTASCYHDTFNNPGGVARVEQGGRVEMVQLWPQYPMTDDETSLVIEDTLKLTEYPQ